MCLLQNKTGRKWNETNKTKPPITRINECSSRHRSCSLKKQTKNIHNNLQLFSQKSFDFPQNGHEKYKSNRKNRSRSQGGATYLNGASHRRPQSLMSLIGVDRNNGDDRNELTITIQKDACGYGMKVWYSCLSFILHSHTPFFSSSSLTTHFPIIRPVVLKHWET